MIYFWLLNLLFFLNFQNTKYTFKIVKVHEGPIIKKRDAGTEDNKYGFEGGRAFKYKGEYHLFTSERFEDPDLVKMRVAQNKLAERKGFEPSIRYYRIHAFQACALSHSATSLF